MDFKTLFRIMAWFGLEGSRKDHLVHHFCREQGYPSPCQVAQSPIQLDLEHVQWWANWQLLWAMQREAALLNGCSKASLEPFFSRLNDHNSLSLSSLETFSSPLMIFVVSSGLTPTDSRLSCTGEPQNWKQCSEWGLTEAEKRVRIVSLNLLPTSFGAAQDMVGFLACRHTLPAPVQFLLYQNPKVIFCSLF